MLPHPAGRSGTAHAPQQHVSPRFLSMTLKPKADSIEPGSEKIHRLVWSHFFSVAIGLLVLAQFIFTICMVERVVDFISAMTISISTVICVIFIMEMILRAVGFRRQYFRSGWFILDAVTIVAGVINIITRCVLLARNETSVAATGANIILITIVVENLRLLRIIRFFQHSRDNPLFHGPWFISRALLAALKALGWISIFLFGMVLFYGMIGAELIGNNEFLREHDDEEISTLAADKFYGVPISMLSVFQIISLDSWSSQLAGPLLLAQSKDATVNGRFRLACMIVYFVSLVASGALIVINMLNAVIVERSIEYGREDAEANFIAKQAEMQQTAKKMETAFVAADLNGDKSLTLDELIATCDDPKSEARSFLLQLGTRDEVVRVFGLLDSDNSGELTIEEFCDGFLRCKQDFNKFLLWQILERQSRDRARMEDMNAHMGAKGKSALAKLSPKAHSQPSTRAGSDASDEVPPSVVSSHVSRRKRHDRRLPN